MFQLYWLGLTRTRPVHPSDQMLGDVGDVSTVGMHGKEQPSKVMHGKEGARYAATCESKGENFSRKLQMSSHSSSMFGPATVVAARSGAHQASMSQGLRRLLRSTASADPKATPTLRWVYGPELDPLAVPAARCTAPELRASSST
jgi:hypothetical protein